MIGEEHVFEEMTRRINLCITINAIIQMYVVKAPKNDIKRGETQDFICEQLNLIKNREICKLINECMTLAGFKSCTLKGYQVYRNADLLVVR